MAEVRDTGRLAALASYDILDTMPEEGFDDVVQLARQLCDAPVSLVSLVAADRQWFKARSGTSVSETDLNASICAHALKEPDLLVIEDLTVDLRTRGNPLVLGEPFLRFYAGAPLRTATGDVLGTLCVIDTVSRPAGLTEAQANALRHLARQVVNLLELRKAASQREAALVRQEVMVQQHRALLDAQHAVGEAAFRPGSAASSRALDGPPRLSRLRAARGRRSRPPSATRVPGHPQNRRQRGPHAARRAILIKPITSRPSSLRHSGRVRLVGR